MAASVLTCKVHPVVLLSVVDAFERRSTKEGSRDKVIGTLLGTYEKNTIEVTGCYAVPFSEAKEDPELDINFNSTMYEITHNAVVTETAVGWFSSDPELVIHTMVYHDYYQEFVKAMQQSREMPPVVLLTVDCSGVSNSARLKSDASAYKPHMNVKAYLRMKAGIPGEEKAHCAIFTPLKTEIATFDAEQIGLDLIFTGTNDPKRQANVMNSVDQLRKATEKMLEWIEQIRTYIDEVLSGKRSADSTIGRKLMDLANSVPQMQPQQFDNMLNSSMRDYLMMSYLSQLAKTQLTLHQKLLSV